VLFCAAAGNSDVNNDETLTYPAYLSRLFPNVITVASVSKENSISGFSNFGTDSVNIAALGEDVLSTVIPETPIYMSGTSMATPYVAGVAAYIRAVAPKTTAVELRRLIDYTALDVESLHRYISSGGVIDKTALRDLLIGEGSAKALACARAAANAALLPPGSYPRQAIDAERYSAEATRIDPKSAPAWHARCVALLRAGEGEGARDAIEKALTLDPSNESAWFDRARVFGELGDPSEVLRSLERSITLLAARGEEADYLRARRLVLRASVHYQLEEVDAARDDLRFAREINPGVDLPGELENLIAEDSESEF